MAKDIYSEIQMFYLSLKNKMDKIVCEDDLQNEMEKYFQQKGYLVLREVSVLNTDALCKSHLDKDHVEIDIVVAVGQQFYPIELKLYNAWKNCPAFSVDEFKIDCRKAQFYKTQFTDINDSYAIAFTDDIQKRSEIAKEFIWTSIGQSAPQVEFKYYVFSGDSKCRAKNLLKEVWNRNVQNRKNGNQQAYAYDTLVEIK